ncbi:MAG: hypothetical protein LBU66_02670 [Treponema sp.]|jgi:hypothetical protein|nr:hypothetical protein [Treponema sp.]
MKKELTLEDIRQMSLEEKLNLLSENDKMRIIEIIEQAVLKNREND